MLILLFVLIWGVINFFTSLFAPDFIPFLGFFSYVNDMFQYGLPPFLRSLSNFDGIFYIRIALKGYSQYEQAFFPLYPILIRYTDMVIKNAILSGVFISYVAFFGAVYMLNKFLSGIMRYKARLWFFLLLLAFPASYYFGVMYTESLFLCMFISSLYFFKKERYIFAGIFGFLSALTRVVGIFILVPYLIFFIEEFIKKRPRYIPFLFACMGPILGLASYSYYLWKTTGDFIYFFHAQEFFGAQRSASIVLLPQVVYRYIRIFLTANHNFQYFVAILEFAFLLFVGGVLILEFVKLTKRKKINFVRMGLWSFSSINLILPTLTGTLTALPRYSLLSLSIFLYLGEIKNRGVKLAIMGGFIILHIIIFAFFVQGYYVT